MTDVQTPNALRAFAAVDLDSLTHNYRCIKSANPEKKVLAVVKADAYGHSAVQVARALSGQADFFGVATVGEGVKLRDAGIDEPILILGRTPVKEAYLLSNHDLSQCVFSFDYANELGMELAALNLRAKIHIKIDTGMSRLGFRYDTPGLTEQILTIARIRSLIPEGIFSHFAKSDVPGDPFTKLQTERFVQVLSDLRSAGLEFTYRHLANSAASLTLEIPECNLVRAGICLYGTYPSEAIRKLWEAGHPQEKLKPVMRFCASVAQIRLLKAGEPLGYDCAYTPKRDTKIAVVAAGYADGMPRRISGKVDAIARGCPIVGNICMDMSFIDVTDLAEEIFEGEIVTLFGTEDLPALSWADAAGTIPYEIYCGISARIPRVTFRGGVMQEIV